MGITLEFHASTGGNDAALFASQLADAVSKHADAPVTTTGRVLSLHRL